MAFLSVGANRMNLMILRRRLEIARKGHKLLKDKQDELMRNFLEIVDQIKGLRAKTEKILIDVLRRFILNTGSMSRQELEQMLIIPAVHANLKVTTARLLNLKVPSFDVEFSGEGINYSLYYTLPELDDVMQDMEEALRLLIRLAETEKKLALLAQEIDMTRRRVNALEHIMIPDLIETIRSIRMKLEEFERGNLTRLMRVKEIIAKKHAQ